VAIARALVNNPSIILVTHEPDIAQYAHRVVHIRDGQVFSDEPSKRFR
jgi:putative ABC transport system ATP-binding protein